MVPFSFFCRLAGNGADLKHNEGNYGEKSSWILRFYFPLVILAVASHRAITLSRSIESRGWLFVLE